MILGESLLKHCGERRKCWLPAVAPFSTMFSAQSKPVAWKEYCAEYRLKELQESMDRFTGHCDITEILLTQHKTPFNQ